MNISILRCTSRRSSPRKQKILLPRAAKKLKRILRVHVAIILFPRRRLLGLRTFHFVEFRSMYRPNVIRERTRKKIYIRFCNVERFS